MSSPPKSVDAKTELVAAPVKFTEHIAEQQLLMRKEAI
jgi:hypothetical protein